MAIMNVAQLASELGMPVDLLLKHLQAVGVAKQQEDDFISEQDKTRLLEHLRSVHGAKGKITLARRETAEIKNSDSAGRVRTIQDEVLKKNVVAPVAECSDTVHAGGGDISSGFGSMPSGTVHAGDSDISSGFEPTPSGTHRAGGADISSGFGPMPSGTVHAGGSDITSGYSPTPTPAAISLNIGDSLVINAITYKFEGSISKETGEAEGIYIVHLNSKKCVFKLYKVGFKPKTDIVELLKQINHDDIIKVLDYGYYHGRFFEIMDCAEGGSIDQHIPIKEESRLKKIVAEIVNAYNFFHSHGIIHKDIKPQNIFFKNIDGTDILIGDFGISTALENGVTRQLTSQSLTVGYAAPEMYGIQGKVIVGKEVDYYALGITLIHIWNGKSPFDNLGPNAMHAIANLTTSGTIPIPVDMPKVIQNLVKGLITVDFTKRWGYEEIQRWLNGEDVPVYFQINAGGYPPFQFSPTVKITTTKDLVKALKDNPPDNGKKKLYSGKLSAWVNIFDQELAAELDRIIEDDYPRDQDAGLQKAIYVLDPDEPFIRHDMSIHDGNECRTVEELASGIEQGFSHYMSALGNASHHFYLYLEAHDAKEEADTFRKYFQTFSAKKALNTIILELRGRDSLELDGKLFSTPEELLKKYKDQLFLVNELKDKESKLSLWIDGTSFADIKDQLEKWRALKKCDETTLAYVAATGNGIPKIEISKANFTYSDLRIGTSSSDSFHIYNNGGGGLSGPITSNKKWLKVSQGNIKTGQHNQEIKFSVDTTGLPFGFKETGEIEIQSNVGVEIVEINISIELGVKAAARFRTGMTVGGCVLGAALGYIIFYFLGWTSKPVTEIAGWVGIIGISTVLGMRSNTISGNFVKPTLITFIVGSIFLSVLKSDWMALNTTILDPYRSPALSIVSWALVFASIAYITSPAILRSLQVGNRIMPATIVAGTAILTALIIWLGVEGAKRIAANQNAKTEIAQQTHPRSQKNSEKRGAKPIAKQFTFIGNFSGDTDNCAIDSSFCRYRVELWRDSIAGIVGRVGYPVMEADTPTGLIEHAKYNPSSGDLSFQAVLLGGWDGVRQDHEVHEFVGKLTADTIKGTFTSRSGKEGARSDSGVLKLGKDYWGGSSIEDITAWQKKYLGLRFNGPAFVGMIDIGQRIELTLRVVEAPGCIPSSLGQIVCHVTLYSGGRPNPGISMEVFRREFALVIDEVDVTMELQTSGGKVITRSRTFSAGATPGYQQVIMASELPPGEYRVIVTSGKRGRFSVLWSKPLGD